jgi:membrane fusion protein, multidrug efflux system
MSWVHERPLIRFGALAASCLILGAGCGRKPSGPPPKPQVTVVTLHTEPVALTTELPGRVSAFRVADVRPQVSGVIQKRLFTEGDRVSAGQQLYQVDPAPYDASLASAKAALERAKASVTAAK